MNPGNPSFFFKLDLNSGYHQIQVCEENIDKMTFWTHKGHWEFLVLPFRLSDAPTTFQALINEVFRAYLRKFVLVFFNDILVYNWNLAEHMEHLKATLIALQDHQISSEQKEVYLGRGN